MSSAGETGTQSATSITTYLHPDRLYNEAYQAVPLDLSDYRPLPGSPTLAATDERGILLAIGDARLRIDVWEEGILRLRLAPMGEPRPSTTEQLGLLNPPPAKRPQWTVVQGRTQFGVRTALLALTLDAATGVLQLCNDKGTVLWRTCAGGVLFSPREAEYSGNRFCCWSEIGDQHFFGFGGRIAPPDRREQSVDVFSVKTGTDSGDYGGFPQPYFISTAGYGFFLNNPWPHVYFDMGRSDSSRWLFHAPGGECDIFLFAGPKFADVVQRFTGLTGRPPLVPRWMLGFWVSSLSMTTAAQALADAKRLRDEGFPCDAFVFDGPWRGGPDFASKYVTGHQYPAEDLDWHREFGKGQEMVRQLHDLGIKTILHLNSRSFSGKTGDAGVAAGLLRRQGEEVIPRVLHQPAEKYYCDLLAPRLDEGVDGWWTDHSDRVSGELRPGLPSRNLFGVLWNRLLSCLMEQHHLGGRPALSRGGGIGSQRYAIPWPGDTRCGIDALADDIWFMLSAGLSGFALTSADLGGFESRVGALREGATPDQLHALMFSDENICRRVCQCLLYMPIPRVHNNCDTIPKLPWNCGERTRRLYKQALEERYRLTPYLYSYAVQASRSGEPLLRPMVYEYPTDAKAIEASTQFFLGDWLLVAPVTEAGQERWRIYLPAGEWTNFWTGEQCEGGRHLDVEAPLLEMAGLPVFVKAGAIICRQPLTLNLEDSPPKVLHVDVYPGGNSEFDLHESATVTNRFSSQQQGSEIALKLENNCGFSRQYVLRFPTRQICSAVGDSANPVSVDASKAAVTVSMPARSACGVRVIVK